ncbi:ABC transporter substrate-binding protein [Bacillus sp. SD088]|uniref:ABC transporter substrate-binding protein n=1 Tax=Bacillus sp. SD088 TaxID=2782012 RepID=UPI001A95DC2F|nr:extracellular solute-binding protein [Bacillus sp. SD088]MBO0991504.1 extracellular solute-binding protein [Bacillus sp. SD088]
MKTKVVAIFVSLLVFSALTGCSNNNAQKTEMGLDKQAEDVVTVKVLYPWGEDAFKQRYEAIDQKLEHIKLELIPAEATSESLQELNAKNMTPDLIHSNLGLAPLEGLDMIQPLDDLIEQYNFDLDSFLPSVVETIRSADSEGRILGLPTNGRTYALFYNKDIFDLFGVPYPEGQLTWTEVLDLSKKMNGERNGQQYRGLELGQANTGNDTLTPLLELGVNLTDPETGEVLITQEPAVTKYFELMEHLYSIPGLYNPDPEAREAYEFPLSTVGMLVSWVDYPRWGIPEADFMDHVGVLPVPVWEDKGAAPIPMGTARLVINKHSEQKEAAFEVISEYLSAEHQSMLAAKYSEVPVLKDEKVLTKFGSESEKLKNLELAPVFSIDYTSPPENVSRWDEYVDIQGSLAEFAKFEADIPTFLRTLEEKSNPKIQEAMSQME